MIEIIRVEDSDLQEIEGTRNRTFRAVSEPLSAGVILSEIQQQQRRRVIVICNTVSQAQGLFRDLTELDSGELKITLLHSRFLPEHRASKETYLKETFARGWKDDGICHVLISTQVIEAGLNITCEVMHVQLCPMNSLLQRAGRCARFSREKGEVYIYRSIEIAPNNSELTEADLEEESEEVSKKKENFLPYEAEMCDRTWQVLLAHSKSPQAERAVGFRTEEEWINSVHGDEDVLQAKRRHNNRAEFEQWYNAAIFQGEQAAATQLIRLVDSRSVFVWEEPSFIDFDSQPIDPKKLVAFSVPTSTLCNVWREYSSLEYKSDWIFKRIEEPKGRAAETYSLPICTEVRSREALISSYRILVNPRYLYYDGEIGLLIGLDVPGNGFLSPDKQKAAIQSEYAYRMDTYVAHLGCMWRCWREPFETKLWRNGESVRVKYASVRDELLQAGGRLVKNKIFPQAAEAEAEVLFEILVFLAILTHDLGKLQVKWQQVMRGWQAEAHSSFNGKNPKSHLLAHTDYNPEDSQQKAALQAYEKRHKRPNHAIESAFLSREILKQSLKPLLEDYFHADSEQVSGILQTVVMAAGRHHSAWAKGWETADVAKIGKIVLHAQAQDAIASSWSALARFLPKTLPLPAANLSKTVYPVGKAFTLSQLQADAAQYQQLYSLVVRALRLCDGRAVQ